MKYNKSLFIAAGHAVLAAFVFFGCNDNSSQSDIFIPVKEKAGNFDFTLCEVSGFDDLSLTEKQLAHHLSKAAIAGDPIVYKQIHPDGYRVKLIIDGIVSHTTGMEERLIPASERFARIFWGNHGSYHRSTGVKYIPEFLDRQRMQFATVVALSNGADIGFKVHKVIQFTYDELEPVIFDNGYESEITGTRIKTWDDEFVSGNFRAGNDSLAPGACGEELSRMVDEIRTAMDFIDPEGREMLNLLARYYETGALKYYQDYLKSRISYKGYVDFTFTPIMPNDSDPSAFFSSQVFLRDEEPPFSIINVVWEAFNIASAEYPDFNAEVIDSDNIEVVTAQILTAAGHSGYGIPPVSAMSQDLNGSRQFRVIVFTNVMDSYLKSVSKASDSAITSQEVIEKVIARLASGENEYGYEPAPHLFITPFTQTVSTKMGKVSDVILDYPETVIEYGIKISDMSRVLPAGN